MNANFLMFKKPYHSVVVRAKLKMVGLNFCDDDFVHESYSIQYLETYHDAFLQETVAFTYYHNSAVCQ